MNNGTSSKDGRGATGASNAPGVQSISGVRSGGVPSGVQSVPPSEAPRSLAQIRPGTTIEGKYLVERVVGRGGMGVVLAATDVENGQRVALKFLEVVSDEMPDDFHARFALEARVCGQLKNRHIARVHATGVWLSKYPFMVMDYLEGQDLRKVRKGNARFPLAQAVDYAVQICEGLAEAHHYGIVHRDLKPANIFVTKQPDGSDLLKVLDFGISKWAAGGDEFSELTRAGTMLGSPKYMSPEQLAGSGVDARADMWSIGAILYGMLAGRPPYDFPQVTQTFIAIASGAPPTPVVSVDPSLPPELDVILLRCLAKDREKRFKDVGELAGALLDVVKSPYAESTRGAIAAVLDGTATSMPARPTFMPERAAGAPSWCSRRPRRRSRTPRRCLPRRWLRSAARSSRRPCARGWRSPRRPRS